MTVSSVDFLVCGWTSTGIPRPSSVTAIMPSGSSSMTTLVAWPAMASSTELSATSHTRWWRPSTPVEPMYMPGRLRTGSRPSRTTISLAPYEPAFFFSSAMRLLPQYSRLQRRGKGEMALT